MKKVNNNSFKKAMSKFSTGLTVISINSKDRYIGKTVNSFASLSLKPKLILFALDVKSSSLDEFQKSRFIGINILSNKQKKISKYFSKKKVTWGKFSTILSKNKVPLIDNAIVNLECKKIKTYKSGDHIIFICKVENLNIIDNLKPLIYYNNKYLI